MGQGIDTQSIAVGKAAVDTGVAALWVFTGVQPAQV